MAYRLDKVTLIWTFHVLGMLHRLSVVMSIESFHLLGIAHRLESEAFFIGKTNLIIENNTC